MIDKNKLITELDKLDCISNINYYTNNCNSHDDIVNTIEEIFEAELSTKEMFEELGLHEQTQTIFKDWIIYGSVFSGQVVFDTSYQTINLNMTITPELHKAIGVKMKELGWI